MSRIARAASCTWPSRAMTGSCGSRVWSMISTFWPPAASQIVRIARPATFIAASPLQNPPGDRVEPGEERGVAVVGCGDQRVFERVIAALRTGPDLARQHRNRRLDQGAGAPGLGDGIADPAADRSRHRDMRDAARSEKTFVAGEGAVDELIDEDEIARSQVFAQAADG